MSNVAKNLKDSLKKFGLKEVSSPEGCHFFLFFCPITSRAGTDIEAAEIYLNEVNKAPKPVIMVVLHYTFDPEKIILDSNSAIKREDIFAVDCLYNDTGLLACEKNTEAISKIQVDSKLNRWTSYYCLKNHGNPCLPINLDANDKGFNCPIL
ncbi:uncharacterized protein si:ch211-271e10.2 [Puntigrus tetrazona]|uniref:uncharacterized protein si:ch211-271e10.2 n=1 Tax=Puntigrus tetrazona TaxID=1606681 RepID=UPI001C88F3B0|nr:uncharacterized protein si:ch211-271e10.2 [Puntigrus tetrazona]